jgi:hypothetical protein
MSEEQKEKKEAENLEYLKTHKDELAERSLNKLEAVRAVKKLSGEDSQWSLTQQMLQEIMASHTVVNPDRLPPMTQMVEELKKEVEIRYADEPELKTLLLESIPAVRSLREWVKKDGWDDAVWGKIRIDGLFTASKRSQVIESLRKRAIDTSDTAAKIWLTLSGDYSEKMDVNDKSVDMFRDINSILLNGKKK